MATHVCGPATQKYGHIKIFQPGPGPPALSRTIRASPAAFRSHVFASRGNLFVAPSYCRWRHGRLSPWRWRRYDLAAQTTYHTGRRLASDPSLPHYVQPTPSVQQTLIYYFLILIFCIEFWVPFWLEKYKGINSQASGRTATSRPLPLHPL